MPRKIFNKNNVLRSYSFELKHANHGLTNPMHLEDDLIIENSQVLSLGDTVLILNNGRLSVEKISDLRLLHDIENKHILVFGKVKSIVTKL